MRKFNNSFPGYNKNEVNLKKRDLEIEKLKNELSHYKTLENTLNRAILIAEEASHSIKKTSLDEAKIVIEDAKKNATRIINNALIKAEKVEREATKLRRQVEMYKRKYKDLLESELEEIGKLDLE